MSEKYNLLNKEVWDKKERFDFYNQFREPYFGISTNIDVTKAYHACKQQGASFFIYYHYLSAKVINEIEALKYRLKDENIVVYNLIHVGTTIIRKDNTFSFSFIPFGHDYATFVKAATIEINRIHQIKGLGINKNSARLDAVHYSTLPWIAFKGISHARKFDYKDSVPKISFGKIIDIDNKKLMPISLHVHYGLVDDTAIELYFHNFQQLINA